MNSHLMPQVGAAFQFTEIQNLQGQCGVSLCFLWRGPCDSCECQCNQIQRGRTGGTRTWCQYATSHLLFCHAYLTLICPPTVIRSGGGGRRGADCCQAGKSVHVTGESQNTSHVSTQHDADSVNRQIHLSQQEKEMQLWAPKQGHLFFALVRATRTVDVCHLKNSQQSQNKWTSHIHWLLC